MALAETRPVDLERDLAGIRRPVNQASHVPGSFYASDEVYALEKEKIFMRDWMLVARDEELAQPGDYLTYQLLNEPIVVTRNAAGELNAFANVCAHRGVEVAHGSGNTNEFSCPYHGWLYDLDGQLVGAPYMKEAEGFDPASCRLRPLKIGIWRGNVFVSFDPDATPLDRFIARFENDFAFLHPEKCRLSKRLVWEFDCNWKLVVENIVDRYHVGTLHADTFGSDTTIEDADISLFDDGGVRLDNRAPPMTPSGKSLFGNLPWIADRPANFSTIGITHPNFCFVARSDQIRELVVWPLGPNRSQAIMYSLFPESHFDQPDFAEKAGVYHEYLDLVLEEDRDMLKSLQHGMSTRTYEPGRLAWLENAIHHLINGVADRLAAA